MRKKSGLSGIPGATALLLLILAISTFASASTYYALYESDPGGLNNVNLVTYDSLADLQQLNASSSTFLNFAPAISMSGLAYDGSQFVGLFESDPGGLNNVNLLTYDSLADLQQLNASSSTFLNFAPAISMSGLAADMPATPAVPEPSAALLFCVGLAIVVRARSREAC